MATGGYSVEQLEVMRAELHAKIIEERTHLRADTERQLLAHRAEQLAKEIQINETRLRDQRAQYAALMAKQG